MNDHQREIAPGVYVRLNYDGDVVIHKSTEGGIFIMIFTPKAIDSLLEFIQEVRTKKG
jgi:hypothetical protein